MKRGFLLKAEAKKAAAKNREQKSPLAIKDSDEQIKPCQHPAFKAEESTHYCKLLYNLLLVISINALIVGYSNYSF